MIYNKNLSPTRSKAVDIVGGCEFTSHKARENAFPAKFIKLQASWRDRSRNRRECASVDELTVDCVAQPQYRIFERELLSYSNREVQLCRERKRTKLNKIFLYVCFPYFWVKDRKMFYASPASVIF